MRFVFIDEVEQHQKNPSFFGLGVFIVNSFFYLPLCSDFQNHFTDCGWNKEIEFKGRYLFSQKGDCAIPVDKRIKLIDNMAEETVAKKNSRCEFLFYYNYEKQSKENYLMLLEHSLKALGRKSKNQGKNLISIYYDSTSLVNWKDINEISDPLLLRKGLFQVELPCSTSGCHKAAGMIYADVLAYLKSWDVLSPKADDEQKASLFELQPGQRDKEKLERIKNILLKVRSVTTKEIKKR